MRKLRIWSTRTNVSKIVGRMRIPPLCKRMAYRSWTTFRRSSQDMCHSPTHPYSSWRTDGSCRVRYELVATDVVYQFMYIECRHVVLKDVSELSRKPPREHKAYYWICTITKEINEERHCWLVECQRLSDHILYLLEAEANSSEHASYVVAIVCYPMTDYREECW
jgi:hypothetical protein